MIQAKVRCQFCGAKNTDITKDRCRICGGVLPDADERRKRSTEGDSFKALVDAEVETWQDYSDGTIGSGSRSRRPAELPPVFAQTAVPGQDMTAAAAPTTPVATSNGHDHVNGNGNGNGNGNANGHAYADGHDLGDELDAAEGGGRLRRWFNKSAD